MKRFILALILLLLLGPICTPSQRSSQSKMEMRNSGSVNSLDFDGVAVMME